jgi:hypothetical protein
LIFVSKQTFLGTDVLLPIIKDWIEKGTTIVSDYWRSYDCLKKEEYQHLKVNHSLNFKDPETGAHTNNIECEWRHAKAQIPGYGRRKYFYPQYLAKYMFLRSCRIKKVDPMVAFCEAAGNLYDARKPDVEAKQVERHEWTEEEVNEEISFANELFIDNYYEETDSSSQSSTGPSTQ